MAYSKWDSTWFHCASNKMVNLFSFNRKITQSMSRKGNCWDNAVAESFLKQLRMNGYNVSNTLLTVSYITL